MPKVKVRLSDPATAPAPAPVTVRRIPVVNCSLCQRPLPHEEGPGNAGRVLTEHYNKEHLAELRS